MNNHQAPRIEYLTIVAATAAEAMDQFSKRGLSAAGYSIAGQIGRHSVSLVSGGHSTDLVGGDGMVAATFRRTVADRA
ncbi:MAG: hypothetical protein Q7T08_01400 [Devosia sp.]|nr:hypothetical protein [Devosia sp.]